MIHRQIYLTDQQLAIHHTVKHRQKCPGDLLGRGQKAHKILAAVGMLWHFAAIVVNDHLAPVISVEILDIIIHRQYHLVGHQPLLHQRHGQLIRHFPHHQPCFFKRIGALENLSRGQAVGLGLIGFDIPDGTAFPAPGMVDQQFCVDAEYFEQQLRVVVFMGLAQRTSCHIAHGVQADSLQPFGVSPAHPPKVRDWSMIPQKTAVAHFVQAGDSGAIGIRLGFLGQNIHSHLAQVQIRTQTGGGGDTGSLVYVPDDPTNKGFRIHGCRPQIGRHIQKHLVNGVHMDILRGDIFQIHLIGPGAIGHIFRHLGRRDDIVHLIMGVGFQLPGIPGFFGGFPAASTHGIHLPHALDHLKQPGSAGNAKGLQAGSHRKANGLVRAAFVRHHQVGGHGI